MSLMTVDNSQFLIYRIGTNSDESAVPSVPIINFLFASLIEWKIKVMIESMRYFGLNHRSSLGVKMKLNELYRKL